MCSADPAPQEPPASAGRQGAGAGTAGQTPGGQTDKQRNTAGKVLLWGVEGMQRGPRSPKESRVQHGPVLDVDSGGLANICRDLTGNTKAQPSALDTMRTETRVTMVCDVSAVARSRAWSITGPLVLALKWTGVCYSNCPLTHSPGTTWEPGRQAQGRLLKLCTSKGSHLTCGHTEELRPKGPTRALPRDSAESPGLLNLSNVGGVVMRGTLSPLPGHRAYL